MVKQYQNTAGQNCLELMVRKGWCELGDVLQSREQIVNELGPVIVKISEPILHQLYEKSVLSRLYVEPGKDKNYLCID
jgi:hypothetical protein